MPKRIYFSLFLIGTVTLLVIGQTVAFLSDEEKSAANIFTAGGLDLKVDSAAHYNGLPCVDGTWAATDLVNGVHRFFNFSDLRPGDYGEDTFSLQLYGNDGWGRLVWQNIIDSDNGCAATEVGLDADCPDVGSAGAGGDLRESLKFHFWLDQGEVPGFQNGNRAPGDDGYDTMEGDNIYQADSEPELIAARPIAAAGETWDLWTYLEAAYAAYCAGQPADGINGFAVCHGLAADGRLVADAVYYFGLGWELPENTGGEAQTDTFGADIVLEATQYRNNEEKSF